MTYIPITPSTSDWAVASRGEKVRIRHRIRTFSVQTRKRGISGRTVNCLEKFFLGESETIYWIGCHNNVPFAFLIISLEGLDETTLDVFICNGLAVSMIREFLTCRFPKMKRVLINHEATNEREVHLYRKVGFTIVWGMYCKLASRVPLLDGTLHGRPIESAKVSDFGMCSIKYTEEIRLVPYLDPGLILLAVLLSVP